MGGFIEGVWFYCCGWIIIGGLAGGLARFILRRPDKNFISDLILGVIGAFIGGIVVGALGWDESLEIGFGIGSLITATIGAALLIFIGSLFSRG
jgi:uncharacterized membrane protein YeaQ/YmgE (transglycosylase-associated protein family)